MKKNLTASLEDYLEAIFIISQSHKVVRVKDLVKHLKVAGASVENALKILKEKGLINHEKYGYIELTEKGEKEAQKIYERHKVLQRFFSQILGLDESTAQKDACAIEHYISEEGLERLIKFLKFIEECPQGTPNWLKSLHYYFKTGKRPEECPKRKSDD